MAIASPATAADDGEDPDPSSVQLAKPIWDGEDALVGRPVATIDWDGFLQYDESCWSELHGPDADPPKPCGDAALVTPKPDAPTSSFVPGISLTDGCTALRDDLELRVSQTKPRYTLDLPIAYANDPTTDGQVDTRYWTPDAAADFWACMGMSPPNVTWALVAVPPTPTIASCLEGLGGPAAVCEPVDDALCTNMEWHESWCGRITYEKLAADETYCDDAIQDAIDDYAAQTGATAELLLMPDVMTGKDGDTEHDMERAYGARVFLQDDATFHDVDARAARADAAGVAADEASKRATWAANGDDVYSCEELAYESVYDYAELDTAARQHKRDTRWMFDEAFYGARALATSAPTRPDIRDSGGDLVWLVNPSYIVDRGFVQWPASDAHAPESQKIDKRMYGHWASGTTTYKTFKNVYYYLHRLRRGPDATFEGGNGALGLSRCEAWRNTQRHHYTVSHGWHRLMDQRMKQDGFIDAELETLARKQDELWGTYVAYVRSNDVDERRELLETIDAALEDGARWGCIPDDPTVNTPCDWSPELYTEGLTKVLEAERMRVLDRCTAELGEGSFDDAELHAKFLDPDALGVTLTPQYTLDDLRTRRNAALAVRYTDSVANMRRFFAEFVGIDGFTNSGYRDRLASALSTIGDDAFVRRTEMEKSVSGEFFSVGFSHHAVTAGADGGASLCDSKPRMRMRNTVDMSLFDLDALEFYDHWSDLGPPIDLDRLAREATQTEYEDWNRLDEAPGLSDFQHSISIEGAFRHEPGFGTVRGGGISWSAEWNAVGFEYKTPLFAAPPLVVSLKLGAHGGISLSGTVSITDFEADDPPADPAELVANGGALVCPSIASTTFDFNVTPAAYAGGYVAVGAGILGIIEVGVKGSLEVVRLSIPITASVTNGNANPTRTPKISADVQIEVIGTLLSGTLSAFAELNLGVFSIPLWEWVIARFTGPQLRLYANTEEADVDACWVAELESFFQSETEIQGLPCPCVLRPQADCIAEWAEEQENG